MAARPPASQPARLIREAQRMPAVLIILLANVIFVRQTRSGWLAGGSRTMATESQEQHSTRTRLGLERDGSISFFAKSISISLGLFLRASEKGDYLPPCSRAPLLLTLFTGLNNCNSVRFSSTSISTPTPSSSSSQPTDSTDCLPINALGRSVCPSRERREKVSTSTMSLIANRIPFRLIAEKSAAKRFLTHSLTRWLTFTLVSEM